MEWPSGKRYTGEWNNGKRHGRGTMIWPSGERYKGQWQQGKRTGYGTFWYGDGSSYQYVGGWADGLKHGRGKRTYADRSIYDGEWQHGMRHGKVLLLQAERLSSAGEGTMIAQALGYDAIMSLQELKENILTTDATAVEMALLVIFTGCLVWYYRARDVPWFVSACVFLSWLLGFMGTLLLPADIVLTLLNRARSLWIVRVWFTLYWTTFMLAWVVIPIMYQSWEGEGLSWKARLRSAVRMNVRQYLLMALVLDLFGVYLVGSGQMNASKVGGFLMALANTYGLVFIILLLGHGLVKVPRKLWETSFEGRELQRHYFIATKIDTDMHDAMFDLEEAEDHMYVMEKAMEDEECWNPDDRTQLMDVLSAIRRTETAFYDEIDDCLFRKPGNRKPNGVRTPTEALRHLGLVVLTPRDAARLHSDLRAAQVKVVAMRAKWMALVRKTQTLQSLLSEIPWGEEVFEATPGKTRGQYWGTVFKRIRNRSSWIWRAYVRWLCCRTLAVLCAVLSAMILWSEVVAASPWDLSPFGILVRCMYQRQAGIAHALSMQVAVLVPFLYMSLCCFRSLFTLRILGSFALQGGHQTLPGPLLINAQYLIRLQFPLGYNFMRILRYNGLTPFGMPAALESPAFERLMTEMKTVPVLGTDFNIYAPMLLVVLCMFTFYKGYARVLRLVGLDHEDLVSIDDAEGQARLEEGRALLERGKRHAQAAALRSKGEGDNQVPTLSPTGRGGGRGNVPPPVAYSKIEDIPSKPEHDQGDPGA